MAEGGKVNSRKEKKNTISYARSFFMTEKVALKYLNLVLCGVKSIVGKQLESKFL